MEDVLQNVHGPLRFDNPPTQFVDPTVKQLGTTLILGFDCEMAQMHLRWATELAWILWKKGDRMVNWVNMDRCFMDWWAMVPWDKKKNMFMTHLIFCNHTGSGAMLNIHKICLSCCQEGLDLWISEVAKTREDLKNLPPRPSGPEWEGTHEDLDESENHYGRMGHDQ